MPWSKPDFVEISLGMEVTAYVNTDKESVAHGPLSVVKEEGAATSSLTTEHGPRSTDP